jgi:hypothetical protein
VTYDVPGSAANRETREVVQAASSYAVRRQPLGPIDLGAWSTHQVDCEGEGGGYVPNTIHLFSMLVNKCRNGVRRAIIFVNFDEAVIALLELMRDRAT